MAKNKPEYEESKTSVWWDIESCPVPVGYDARRVGACIESSLENFGYSGPFTINGMCDLKTTSAPVLRALSSTGIFVQYVPSGTTNFVKYMNDWLRRNPLPVTIMVVSDSYRLTELSHTLSYLQKNCGCTILLAYPDAPEKALDVVPAKQWLWESLLKYAKFRETGFTCVYCEIDFPSFEKFARHLKGEKHEHQDSDPYFDHWG